MKEKKFSVILIIFLLLFVFSYCSGSTTNSTNKGEESISELTVNNVEDLLMNIEDNKTIYIEKGKYIFDNYTNISTDYVEWNENYDGSGVLIRNVSNLKLIANDSVEFICESEYSSVMSFSSCNSLLLEGITFGHETVSECGGGVLYFIASKNIKIEKCDLYGSGIEGLYLENVDSLAFNNSIIRECTYDFLFVYNSSNLVFSNSVFKNNIEYDFMDFINLCDAQNVTFDNVKIIDNALFVEYDDYFTSVFYVNNSYDIVLKNSVIKNNNVAYFSSNPDDVIIENTNEIDESQFFIGLYENN